MSLLKVSKAIGSRYDNVLKKKQIRNVISIYGEASIHAKIELFSDMKVLMLPMVLSTEWRKAWLMTVPLSSSQTRKDVEQLKMESFTYRMKVSQVPRTTWPSVKPLCGSTPHYPSACLSKSFLREVLLHYCVSWNGPFLAIKSSLETTHAHCLLMCRRMPPTYTHPILVQAIVIWALFALLYFFMTFNFLFFLITFFLFSSIEKNNFYMAK